MRYFRLAKPFAAVLFFLVALAMPGTALAHGLAHLEEHEHGAHHQDARVTEGAEPSVSAADHGHDHQHPVIDAGLRVRPDLPQSVQAVPPALPVARQIATSAATPAPRALLPRGDPAAGPPPRLRAPPIR